MCSRWSRGWRPALKRRPAMMEYGQDITRAEMDQHRVDVAARGVCRRLVLAHPSSAPFISSWFAAAIPAWWWALPQHCDGFSGDHHSSPNVPAFAGRPSKMATGHPGISRWPARVRHSRVAVEPVPGSRITPGPVVACEILLAVAGGSGDCRTWPHLFRRLIAADRHVHGADHITHVDHFGPGYVLYRIVNDAEELLFLNTPPAPGITALTNTHDPQQSWRWRCFSTGGMLGMCYGYLHGRVFDYRGVPPVADAYTHSLH